MPAPSVTAVKGPDETTLREQGAQPKTHPRPGPGPGRRARLVIRSPSTPSRGERAPMAFHVGAGLTHRLDRLVPASPGALGVRQQFSTAGERAGTGSGI